MDKKITELDIWRGTLFRAIAIMGMYFFSTAIVMGISKQLCIGSFIVAGLYYFSEIMRFYGLDLKKVIGQFANFQVNSRKKYSYTFLLWP